ncbi:hypothetical protein ALC62_13641 [Cyphomyrmex costatus]|uniref:Uncharacterized protein n=1 Tax=Cyphomyrmex costatus TaxID=456900 RepID=A0A151IA19_9HYME|nr:hypothetical protein ALC62_13641 [Cyphomyrmex costatus]
MVLGKISSISLEAVSVITTVVKLSNCGLLFCPSNWNLHSKMSSFSAVWNKSISDVALTSVRFETIFNIPSLSSIIVSEICNGFISVISIFAFCAAGLKRSSKLFYVLHIQSICSENCTVSKGFWPISAVTFVGTITSFISSVLELVIISDLQFVLLFRRRHEFPLEFFPLFLFLVFLSAYILFLYLLRLPQIPVHFVPLSWKD